MRLSFQTFAVGGTDGRTDPVRDDRSSRHRDAQALARIADLARAHPPA
jgi:hypothetical protein